MKTVLAIIFWGVITGILISFAILSVIEVLLVATQGVFVYPQTYVIVFITIAISSIALYTHEKGL